jgi:hypothetical protein
MTGLVLNGTPVEHNYRPNVAAVFINYGTLENPKDHKGRNLYQEPFDFFAHLENELLPKLNDHLSDKYRILEVDMQEGGAPFLCVIGQNNKQIDYQNLKKAMEKTLASYNKASHVETPLAAHGVFKKKNKESHSNASEEKHTPRYKG